MYVGVSGDWQLPRRFHVNTPFSPKGQAPCWNEQIQSSQAPRYSLGLNDASCSPCWGNLGARKAKEIPEALKHQHITSEMAIMTAKQTKQPSECMRQKSQMVPTQRTIEALERAERERDEGAG